MNSYQAREKAKALVYVASEIEKAAKSADTMRKQAEKLRAEWVGRFTSQ